VAGLLNNTAITFFHPPNGTNNTMYELSCEPYGVCNTDQLSFKAYLSRFMGLTITMVPWTSDIIIPLLQTSAINAAKQCSSGPDGNTCGFKWTLNGTWDGTTGVGQQLDALETIQNNLVQVAAPPVTHNTGGTSQGNPAAGTDGDQSIITSAEHVFTITTASRAGAGILTALTIFLLLGGAYWLMR
jgi:mannan endo-1,6-alpha-mannosidase